MNGQREYLMQNPEYWEQVERLHHGALTVHELGEMEDIHFIAATLVDGTTLRDRIIGQKMKLSYAVDAAIPRHEIGPAARCTLLLILLRIIRLRIQRPGLAISSR